MFWRTQTNETLGIAELLNKENVKLQEILDDQYTLQEVKCNNQKLIDFLKTENILLELTQLCLTEPCQRNQSTDLKQYKYAHLASEILSADAEPITLALSKNAQCFSCLSKFLSVDEELNPLLASFFAKIISLLVQRFPGECLSLIQKENLFLDNCCKHLNTYAIVDALFRFCVCVDSDEEALKIRTWLCEQNFLTSLLLKFDTNDESCDNATYLIAELVRYLRESYINSENPTVDPLLQQLQSTEFLENLLNKMISKKGKVFVNGCSILLAMLQTAPDSFNLTELNVSKSFEENVSLCKRQFPAENAAKLAQENLQSMFSLEQNLLKILSPKLADFAHILSSDNSAQQDKVLLPMGLTKMMGNEKIYALKLITQLLILPSSYTFHEHLASMNFLNVILDNFFGFPWNNFFHCHVCHIFYFIFNKKLDKDGTEVVSPLLKSALEKCSLLNCILERWAIIKNQGFKRSPYRGHLLKLAEIVKNARISGANSDYLKIHLSEQPSIVVQQWMDFEEDVLNPFIKLNEPDQVGPRPVSDIGLMQDDSTTALLSSSNNLLTIDHASLLKATAQKDDFPNSKGTEFTSSTDLVKDEKENFPTVSAPMDFAAEKDGSLNSQDTEISFENLCKERVNSIGQSNDDDDMWFEREITFSKLANERFLDNRESDRRQTEDIFKSNNRQTSSSSSDDETNNKKMDIDVDPWADFGTANKQNTDSEVTWANFSETASSLVVSNFSSPASNCAPSESNWADFDSQNVWPSPANSAKIVPQNATGQQNDSENWADFSKSNLVSQCGTESATVLKSNEKDRSSNYLFVQTTKHSN